MIQSVYIKSLIKTGAGIEVTASNGTENGPPFVKWIVTDPVEIYKLRIGRRFRLKIVDDEG
jgi:hypothetical protein